jgi:hypothetical protein
LKKYTAGLLCKPRFRAECIVCGDRATRAGSAEGCGHACFCNLHVLDYRKTECARIADERAEEEEHLRAIFVAEGHGTPIDEDAITEELDEIFGPEEAPFIGCPQCRTASMNYKTVNVKLATARKEAIDDAREVALALAVHPGQCSRCDN